MFQSDLAVYITLDGLNANMPTSTAIEKHRKQTKALARSLKPTDVYQWLLKYGYFPELSLIHI